MIVRKKRSSLAATLFCGAAIVSVAGCGGGGGASADVTTPLATALEVATTVMDPTPAIPIDGTSEPVPATPEPDAPRSHSEPPPAQDGIAAADIDAAPVPAPPPVVVASAVSEAGPAPTPVAAPAPTLVAAPAPAPTPVAAPAPSAGPAPSLADCEMFPPEAIFNTRVDDTSRFPVHPQSANWVNMVGGGVPFRTDWGTNANPANTGDYWGMPINVVDGSPATTSWPTVLFDYAPSGDSLESGWPYKSDCAVADGAGGFALQRDCTSVPSSQNRFPFPHVSNLLNENGLCGGPTGCGMRDHHVLVVETGACRLWESFFAHNLNGQWYALTTAAWNLRSMELRPTTWASGDAAGLPITPLLAKAAEADAGEIRHALRVTFRDPNIDAIFDWPARHAAGGANPGAFPFGALLRLKADFVIPADWTPQAKALATAAKRYGLYVADNGEDFFVQGEPSAAWNPATFAQIQAIKMSDMEFVDLKAVKSDPRFSNDSMQARW